VWERAAEATVGQPPSFLARNSLQMAKTACLRARLGKRAMIPRDLLLSRAQRAPPPGSGLAVTSRSFATETSYSGAGNPGTGRRVSWREQMSKSVSMIGIDPGELRWVRMLLFLLRHPDPLISEMARQTLVYLVKNAHEQAEPGTQPLNHAG